MIWDIDPVLIQFDWLASPITNGPLQIRYYGLFFAIGLLGGAWAFPTYFERWGYPRQQAERLTLWMPIGMIVGAHLIHLIFYETSLFTNFFSNPNALTFEHLGTRLIQIGSGLASHGGGLGAIVAIILFARRHKADPLAYMDSAMCGASFVIPWVRVGNFFNSEIVGRPWDGPWAVAFPRHDCPGYPSYEQAGRVIEVACDNPILRHPSQVYEAVLGFILLGGAIYLQAKWRHRLRPGAVLFILLAYYFTTRFFIEYVKEYQTLSDNFPLTMGQCLSLPIVLICVYMLLFSKKSNILKPLTAEEARRVPPPGTPLPSELEAESTASKKETSKKKTTSKKASKKGVSSSDDETPPKKTSTKRKKKRKKRS